MRAPFIIAFVLAFAPIVRGGNNSVEVTLEDTLAQQEKDAVERQQQARRWHFFPSPRHDSDSRFEHWRSKFNAGSDKRLGNAKDEAAIKSIVDAVTIRWVSRRLVVVDAGGLKVLEKKGSKWEITHYYIPRIYLPTI